MKTTFGNLNEKDLFINQANQVCQKGYGVWRGTEKVLYCPEGDVGRFWCNDDEPVTKLKDFD